MLLLDILYIMKLVPLWNIGFWKFKVSKWRKFLMQALFKFLVLGDASRASGVDWKEEEEALSSSLEQSVLQTNTLEHTQNVCVNEHVLWI